MGESYTGIEKEILFKERILYCKERSADVLQTEAKKRKRSAGMERRENFLSKDRKL